jgi:predicted RNase H-like HicB family nuclease
MRPRYAAEVERSGRWWAIRVPELGGVHSQSRTLDGVEPMVREAIALFLDVGEETFDVEIRQALEPELERVVHEAILARSAALEQQQAASAKARAAVMVLRDRGLPQRDIGRLLKLSHQRVAQLLDSTAP